MIRNLSVAALVACLAMGACTSQTKTHGSRDELYKGVNYESFVRVAVIDPAKAEHVTALLESNGIPNVVEGSKAYGVSVPPAKKEKAIALLKADSEKGKYYIQF
jgi:ABC-type oligopeptide transport system substrate-binding subunit